MKLSELKYLSAYILPLCAFIGIWKLDLFTFLTPVVTFILIPIIEFFTPENKTNLQEEERLNKNKKRFFDVLLYLNLPILIGILYYGFYTFQYKNVETFEVVGLIFSIGIVLGSNGINVAHELGHRENWFAKWISKLLLLPSFYTHFTLEHNYGHHVHVSTPDDPATARYNQNVYAFWFQSALGQYKNAWKVQSKLNKANSTSFFSIKNEMLLNTFLQFTYLIVLFSSLGIKITLYAVAMGIVGFLLLESINYIEHYGLLRKQRKSGRYLPVKEIHSWNSNHLLGRILLYELTRHSDHHYRASKKYQILEYYETSPELPYGYPTSIVLALIPSLWFKIMNKKIPSEMKEFNKLLYQN
jgi:alkane 1-monooxygenase